MANQELLVGIKGNCSEIVEQAKTAQVVGSGDTAVYATPAMIALVEKTAVKTLEGFLEGGKTTVGTLLNVKHLAPTPVGMEVRCECVLSAIDRRRLVFNVEVYDECGIIGEGVHERFIVDKAGFQQKAEEKRKK